MGMPQQAASLCFSVKIENVSFGRLSTENEKYDTVLLSNISNYQKNT